MTDSPVFPPARPTPDATAAERLPPAFRRPLPGPDLGADVAGWLRARLAASTPGAGRRRSPGPDPVTPNGVMGGGDRARTPPGDVLATAVAEAVWRRRGDHDLNDPDLRPRAPLIPAAVLVPVVLHAEGPSIILTRRTAHLHAHAGQISFPGGRIDPGDTDPVAAALRETEEEIGLPPDRFEIIGRLDTYEIRTGFEVTPVVGLLRPPVAFRPDPFEVAEVFEVPLGYVLDSRNHRRERALFKGVQRSFYVLPYGGRNIWGATAGMLINLYEVLAAETARAAKS